MPPAPPLQAESLRRIRLTNVNRYFLPADVRKWLLKQVDCTACSWFSTFRIRKTPRSGIAFLSFSTENEHKHALEFLGGVEMKCKGLLVAVCDEEPVARRHIDSAATEGKESSPDLADTRTPFERIADKTIPLWRMEYAAQLDVKKKIASDAICRISKDIGFELEYQEEDPVPSLEIEGYRTKCEFTIGRNVEGLPTVGMNVGRYKDGVVTVAQANGLKHVKKAALEAAEVVQEFIKSFNLSIWDRQSHSGTMRLFLARTPRSSENMFVLQASDKELVEVDAKDKLQSDFKEFFLEKAAERNLSVSYLGMQYYSGVTDMFSQTEAIIKLYGEHDYVSEELLGFKFRISPTSFFQVNTPAAEQLYSKISSWAVQNTEAGAEKPVLLDLCCGTGTIGIALSPYFSKIVGVDIVEEAIRDARSNTELNKVHHASYVCGPVEKVLDEILLSPQFSKASQIVAVLDPPRGGVHPSVVKAVRKCRAINEIVFVCCDIKSASRNIVELCRGFSNKLHSQPFELKRSVVVDMFPHTNHFETVLHLSRQSKPRKEEEVEVEVAAAVTVGESTSEDKAATAQV